MTIEAVVFDIGGVLEHTPRTGWEARWAERLGLATATFTERLAPNWAPGSTGEASLQQVERSIAAEFGLRPEELRALMDDAWAEYVGMLNRPLTDFFRALRPRYRTGILSNSFVGAREREEALYGFSTMCDVMVYSHEVGCLKPDPRIYRIACEQLDVVPEHAVLLDDVPANVAGARAVGMHAVEFRDTAQAVAEIDALLGR